MAELSAAFLCAELGITNSPRADHAQYLAHWLKVLKADDRAIFTAASAATRATQFLIGLQPDPVRVRLASRLHDAADPKPVSGDGAPMAA